MKYILFSLVLVFTMTPTYAFAVCSDTGSTVVFVNGILNSRYDADLSNSRLQQAFQEKFSDTNVKFITGYNPSHLAGLGDLAQSGAQMLGSSVSDFDLKTILIQIQPEVATRKILLVGHSQGTLYTNSIYNYLINHGVPKESIAVYNVATPAREVSGGGIYLTSSNDALINALAALAEKTGLPAPFPPNIDIPIQPGDTESAYPGHNFIRAYLPGASDKIVSDISHELGSLRADKSAETCFTAPLATIGYKIEGALFAVADPFAGEAVSAAKTTARAELAAGEFLGGAIAAAGGKIINTAAVLFAFSDKAQPVKEAPKTHLEAKLPSASLPRQGGASEAPNLAVAPPSSDSDVRTSDVGTPLPSDVSPQSELSPPLQGGVRGGTAMPSRELPPFLQLHAVGGSPGFGGGSPAPLSSPSGSSTSDVIPSVTPPDVTPPDISLSVSECGSSLSSDGCLLASSTVSLVWSSTASDLNHYIVECEKGGAACSNFSFASTTATSTVYTLPADDADYIFKAKAVDNSGNESGETTKTISLSTRPVVINEVAWAGTAASANDEWIELYNRSSKNVNLANWVLYAEDGVPYINLSGDIAARGYYLIERTDDNTVSDVASDLTTPFSGLGAGSGLSNTNAEILKLSHASTTVDQTPNCGTNWISCGGAASGAYPTMERIDPEAAGTNFANWGTSNGVVKNGLDSAGAALTATPRARNSLHYLIAQGQTLAADRTLKKSFGTYIIKNNENFTVSAGKTLTIEPGVTLKIGSESRLVIEGTLKADGTSVDNIIFKSLNDPAAYWKTVRISSGSTGSSVSYSRFEYGGRFFSDTPGEERAALSIFGNSTPVAHSVFQNSLSAGLRLTLSDSSVSGNTFSVGTTTANNAGLYVSGGLPTVSGNTFSQNYTGIYLTGAGNITDNVFENNIDYPIYSLGGKANYSGNSGSGNGKNGIALTGNIATAGATTTLSANALPYITSTPPYNNAAIPAGAGVVMGPGAKLAGENNESELAVRGTLKLEGTSKESIIFTSLADTAPAQWSGILVHSTGRVYGGGFTLRYGGKGLGCPSCAGFRVEGGSVDLKNAIIQNNYLAGMRFSGAATSTLDNFEFRDHQTPTGESIGLVSSNSPLTLTNLIFSNNHANTSPESLY